MAWIRRPGSPTFSRASQPIPRTGLTSCCRGTGDLQPSRVRRWRPEMHVNKVQRVTTIERVAADLGESVDWLYYVATEMDAEDGVISVYGPGDHQLIAFTDFGIKTLIELIKIHKELPSCQS